MEELEKMTKKTEKRIKLGILIATLTTIVAGLIVITVIIAETKRGVEAARYDLERLTESHQKPIDESREEQ